ncbi:glycosyltransferase family 2 protein [Candidatus Uhrbacteria bacterium]|nr:glycosyltransferase family 2 protein [Candidatus Uhrbacteria bacterium]
MRVAIHILAWNDRRYLPELLASLDAQEYKDTVVRILDNGSTDGETVNYLQQHVPHALVGRNVRNLGFAPGHNQLVRFTLEHLPESELDDWAILVMNADMILDPKMVGTLVAALDTDPSVSIVQPKIYRAFGEHVGDESLEETVRSDILDSTGLRVTRGWRMVERGAGDIDTGQFDAMRDVFGPSGACAMFRARAVRDLLIDGELFDGDFFAYREDCDLAWRARAAGYRTAFVPQAKLWHYRGMYGAERQTLWQRLTNRTRQRPFFAALGTRNQLFVLLKNLTFVDALLAAPWMAFHETGRVLYGLLFEPETRKVLIRAPFMVPAMLRKRAATQAMRIEPGNVLRGYVGK